MRHAVVVAVGLSCLVGCFSTPPRPPDPIHFSSDSEAMRREVLQHIPYGMPLKQARAILEANGFECSNNTRSRVLVAEARPGPVAAPIQVWVFYDPQETVKEIQARAS